MYGLKYETAFVHWKELESKGLSWIAGYAQIDWEQVTDKFLFL